MTRVQSPSPYAVNACIRWMKVSGKVLTHPDRGKDWVVVALDH